MRSQDILDEIASVIYRCERGAGVQVAGIAQNIVEFPTQTQIQGQIRVRLPIVLHVRAEIRVGIERHDRRTGRGSTLESDRNRDVEVVHGPVSV